MFPLPNLACAISLLLLSPGQASFGTSFSFLVYSHPCLTGEGGRCLPPSISRQLIPQLQGSRCCSLIEDVTSSTYLPGSGLFSPPGHRGNLSPPSGRTERSWQVAGGRWQRWKGSFLIRSMPPSRSLPPSLLPSSLSFQFISLLSFPSSLSAGPAAAPPFPSPERWDPATRPSCISPRFLPPWISRGACFVPSGIESGIRSKRGACTENRGINSKKPPGLSLLSCKVTADTHTHTHGLEMTCQCHLALVARCRPCCFWRRSRRFPGFHVFSSRLFFSEPPATSPSLSSPRRIFPFLLARRINLGLSTY